MPNESNVEMVDGDIGELLKNFSTSSVIKIPTEMLSTEYAYRWVNRSNPKTLMKRRGIGWDPIKAEELDGLVVDPYTPDELFVGTGVSPEGWVVLGVDLVLAKMPIQRYRAIKQHQEKLNRDKLAAGRRRFHQAGELVGVRTYEDE